MEDIDKIITDFLLQGLCVVEEYIPDGDGIRYRITLIETSVRKAKYSLERRISNFNLMSCRASVVGIVRREMFDSILEYMSKTKD